MRCALLRRCRDPVARSIEVGRDTQETNVSLLVVIGQGIEIHERIVARDWTTKRNSHVSLIVIGQRAGSLSSVHETADFSGNG